LAARFEVAQHIFQCGFPIIFEFFKRVTIRVLFNKSLLLLSKSQLMAIVSHFRQKKRTKSVSIRQVMTVINAGLQLTRELIAITGMPHLHKSDDLTG
jgi:hypothetical protein